MSRRRRNAAGGATEAQVQKTGMDALRYHPGVAWVERINVMGRRNEKGGYTRSCEDGTPDAIGQMVRPGQLLQVEFKAPGKWPAHALIDRWEAMPAKKRGKEAARIVAQRSKLRRCWENGGHAGVVEDALEVSLVCGPLRLPLRLWPAEDGVPF